MGMDKLLYLNSIEATSKALSGAVLQKSVPEQEFMNLAAQSQLLSKVQAECDQLKDCLVLVHTELKASLERHLPRSLLQAQLWDRYGVTPIKEIALQLPQSTYSMAQTCKIFLENARKLGHFFETVLSPTLVGEVIADLNQTLKDGDPQAPVITSLEELRLFLKQNIGV